MPDRTNRQFRLAARPAGLPKPTDWELTTESVPAPREGEVLIQVLYVSIDPAMRHWMNEGRSYTEPVQIGDVMRAGTVGCVIESRNRNFRVGDCVVGGQGVQLFAISSGRGLRKVDPALAPLPAYLGGLGVTGLTAFFGLLEVGRARAGDTVVVSAAAGAVGSVVGQLAKIGGSRAVGIAGGRDKCAYLLDIGFDAAIDYKSENVEQALDEHCPHGIDVYFDNVGGDILDSALAQLARGARVVLCGAISQYNLTTAVRGPTNYLSLLFSRARMEGFVTSDYKERYEAAIQKLARWRAEGRLQLREDIVDGLEAFPETLLRLFRGENTGKLMLKVAEV